MEIAEAKALTEALTGKVLPTKREKIAAAVYGSLNALYLVAEEKEVTIEGTSPIKHFIALTASRLVDEEKSDKEVRAYALEVVRAAGLIVDSLSIHLGVKAAEAFNKYLR